MSVSELVIATLSRSRYFDLDAVRHEHTVGDAGPYRGRKASAVLGGDSRPVESGIRGALNPAGAPPLDWWLPLPEEQDEWDRWGAGENGRPSDYTKEGTTVGQARYIIGDSLTVLRSMPDASVDLVLTSPPFLALRSYLPADHVDKGKEVGSEATPGAFIDALLDIAEECRRVLAPHGSLCFELGDTYSGSGGGGGDYLPGGLRENQPGFGGSAERQREGNAAHWRQKNAERDAWPLDKSLCLIPESFRWALVYGRNPFTGRETPPWRVRNVVRWARPNPPVGALGDKVRPATSDMVIACMSKTRYFDLDAVRAVNDPARVDRRDSGGRPGMPKGVGNASAGADGSAQNPAGAPPLDWWEPLPEEREEWDCWANDLWVIPTAPYKGSHYATWPPMLCVRPIEAMTPRRVCTTCGEPSRRIVEMSEAYAEHRAAKGDFLGKDHDAGKGMASRTERRPGNDPSRLGAQYETLGWTDCGHDAWRNGIVLDPFAGSGTTLAVATGHGRDAIGIDLDARNGDLAAERIGMFLTVEYHQTPEAVA